jgi:hypothetical protein
VTESSPSVQTCRLSVVRDAQRSAASRSWHKSTRQSRAIYAHNIYNQQFEKPTHLISTRAIPTLYGVLPRLHNHSHQSRDNAVQTVSSTKSTWKHFKSFHSPLLSLTCPSSCATLTHGVSRFRFSPPIITNTIVAIEPRSPHIPLQPIYHLSRIYTASIVLPVWLNKSLAVGSYSLNRLDCPATFSFLLFLQSFESKLPGATAHPVRFASEAPPKHKLSQTLVNPSSRSSTSRSRNPIVVDIRSHSIKNRVESFESRSFGRVLF